jgi:Dual-action HEIGH metallo-peptidase
MYTKILLALGSVFVASCGLDNSVDTGSSTEGLVNRSNLWPGATASVCLIKSTNGNDAFKTLMEETLVKGINDRTVFRFTGFTYCDEKKADVYVTVEQEGRPNAGVGVQGERGNNGYKGGARFFIGNNGRNYPNYEMKTIILHEFGHVMGLHHEHVRDDSTCNKEPGGASGSQLASIAVKVGSYDKDSIMNYCKTGSARGELALSPGDITTVNTAYASVAPTRPVENNPVVTATPVPKEPKPVATAVPVPTENVPSPSPRPESPKPTFTPTTEVRTGTCDRAALLSCVRARGGYSCYLKHCN